MFNLIIAIWLGAILNIGFYHQVHTLTPYLGIKATLFLAATVVIVVATYYAALQIFKLEMDSQNFLPFCWYSLVDLARIL
ncbi:hypothetical protein BJI64_10310 [Acinetobacter baumannii]|nr:hypothetical protein BJI64_10310 [Acinetobacter baumannii]